MGSLRQLELSGLLQTVLVVIVCLSGEVVSIVLEGSQTSFAQFHQWHGGVNGSLELQFRTSQANALLLYTDNIQCRDYVQLSLVEGVPRLRYNWGGGPRMLMSDWSIPVNDSKWHRVLILKSGLHTSLVVDDTQSDSSVVSGVRGEEEVFTGDSSATSKSLKAKKHDRHRSRPETDDESLVGFGDPSTNSYVFVGGIPPWKGQDIESLVLPMVLLETRFHGEVKAIRYRDVAHASDRFQEMMAYRGVRAQDVDVCKHQNPCQNQGLCLPTDSGPICDCSNTKYQGDHCETMETPLEVTLTGGEYLSYNLFQRGIDPILSINDEISLYFKTRKSSGLLFHTGNENDYMSVSLIDGGVALTVQIGSGVLDTGIKPNSERFNDNKWHHVRVHRRTSEVTLSVDGRYTEKWVTSGPFTLLISSLVFVGGSETSITLPGARASYNWVGCLKEVIFKADSLVLDLLQLGLDGNPMISVIGDLQWSCQDIASGAPMAFKSDSALPSWNVSFSGSISYQFRTTETNGLILFNGGGDPGKDYFAMELLDGHLHVHLDLGSGSVKIRASRVPLNDGRWHQVELTIKKQIGRITIDGETEAFETPGDASQLDLRGQLYIGSVDYMDPYLRLPPAVWSSTLRYGFVGCFKDLRVNGSPLDVVFYAHQQDVGSIRSSCHKMPGQCHDKPCMHGGVCSEGWNRYMCDCSQTSFAGAICGNAATTLKFEGSHSMGLAFNEGITHEAEDVSFRFRTNEPVGLLMTTMHDRSQDKLELSLEGARVRVLVRLENEERVLFAGQSLNDDIYHSVNFKRRGAKIVVVIDDEDQVEAQIRRKDTRMSFSKIYIGNIDPSELLLHTGIPGFVGSMQQLIINGQAFLELAGSGQLSNHKMNAILVESSHEMSFHNAMSFSAKNAYIGLPQMKAFNSINLRFQFRTFEQNGLLMYNAGKASDFIAIELVNGRLHYTLNLGYGPFTIADTVQGSLADNKWHKVIIGRPSRYRHTLMVDGHVATASAIGDNFHLDLDGILYLGGVRDEMYSILPRPMVSRSGFQGCFGSFETNGELVDPVKHALVPSPLVEEGCEESVACQWGTKGGAIRYTYPSDKRPDTNSDILSLGFITPSFNAILARVDSNPDSHKDFLQLEIVAGKVFLNYNLGSKDITIGDINTKVNDGKYHVVRFTRNGANSTLQIDDNPPQNKFPQSNRQLTVFNDQSLVQIGGLYNPSSQTVERPFVGVIAAALYNGLRPLDLAASKKQAKFHGDVRVLKDGIPFDYKDKHPSLFTEEAMKTMMDNVFTTGGSFDVTNADQVAHSSIAKSEGPDGGYGSNAAGAAFLNCDDEEDCVGGSGSGDGPFNPGSLFPETNDPVHTHGGTDSHYVPLSTHEPYRGFEGPQNTPEDEHDNWAILLYPQPTPPVGNTPYVSPTLLPLPLPPGNNLFIPLDKLDEEKHVAAFDEKWNVPDMTPGGGKGDPSGPRVATKSMPGTMVLVIGIILGAFVAMILIVIIVLKMRTRVDGTIKCEEAPRYQFAPPNDYGELGDQETATTSLMEGAARPGVSTSGGGVGSGLAHPSPNRQSQSTNGFLATARAINGERSRLFCKSNGSKPVREWYV
ncbi:hypothetical protein TCAL_01738 [Tigriopus californicus]|uniref:Laminin G domain-containing protein n=1 Tax=Tigriopus californicus TaxID=6832 RepID=A0A553PKZ8_TIGCA|nr:hypothetical protein TCAL_01738 [Tigriopus californicus]